MPDYNKGKIYKLWSPSKNLVYYGSTCETLPQRLASHRCKYKTYMNTNKNYITAYKVLECEDYKIELIEDYPCNNKQQLCKKEGEYIRELKCVNKNIAGRTYKEWEEENKEKRSEQHKQYDKVHKQQIKEKKQKHY